MSDDLRHILDEAGLDPNALGPFVGLLEAFDAVVQQRIDERASEPPPVREAEAGTECVRGIDPHRLYTSAQVAERLGYESEETVRRADENLLPRAPWRGPGVRYWGSDVLRYMGVPDGEIGGTDGATVHRMPTPAPPTPAQVDTDTRTSRDAPKGKRTSRIKNNDLPSL